MDITEAARGMPPADLFTFWEPAAALVEASAGSPPKGVAATAVRMACTMQTETRKHELATVRPSARSVAIVFSVRRSVEGELSVAAGWYRTHLDKSRKNGYCSPHGSAKIGQQNRLAQEPKSNQA